MHYTEYIDTEYMEKIIAFNTTLTKMLIITIISGPIFIGALSLFLFFDTWEFQLAILLIILFHKTILDILGLITEIISAKPITWFKSKISALIKPFNIQLSAVLL